MRHNLQLQVVHSCKDCILCSAAQICRAALRTTMHVFEQRLLSEEKITLVGMGYGRPWTTKRDLVLGGGGYAGGHLLST